MSIIAPTDFKAENTIAQIETLPVRNLVQSFIDKYEPKFLKELLGLTLYQEFITGLTPVPVDPPTDPPTYEPIDLKWIALRDETDLKAMIVDYVYVYYLRNVTTSTTGTSEVKAKNNNSTPVNSIDKQVRAWNEMVNMARLFDLSTETYPNWHRVYWRNWWYGCNWHLPEIYKYDNSLGI